MGSILSIIGIFILAALKLEQFVYGKSGKQQSTTGHVTRRGIANIAGLIAFDHAIRRKILRNEYLPSFFAVSKKLAKIYR